MSETPSPPEALLFSSIASVSHLIAAGALSPVELVERQLGRIRALDPLLHSYVTLVEDQALAAASAAASEIRSGRYRGVLHGIPVGVKDLLFTRGIPTRGGTEVFRDFVPEFDATVVRRLAGAGAILLGKHTLCEGAMGPYHPHLKVPKNPWNNERWAGVSSSGSGVAVAAGLCFASIGTDTGGSIRYPAAANGCVGLKPTYGRISRYGVLPLAESLDHVGPICRTVEDVAMVFDAVAGHDHADPTSRPESVEPTRGQLSAGIKGLRIGYDKAYSSSGVDVEVTNAMDAVLATLVDLGAVLIEVTMPDLSRLREAWWDLSTAAAAAFHAPTHRSRREEYGPGFLAVLDYGARVRDAQIQRAQAIKNDLVHGIEAMLKTVDCFVCPTMSNASRPAPVSPSDPDTRESWTGTVINDVHTKPFNFSGSPTLSVPCGFSSDGLPLSAQFVGRALSEAVVCRVGHAYEQASQWHERHPAF